MGAKPLPIAKAKPAGLQAVCKVKGAKATGVREELEEIRSFGAFHLWLRNLLHETPSWLTSMVVHMAVLLVLALLTLPTEALQSPLVIASDPPEDLKPIDALGPSVELPAPLSFGDPHAAMQIVPPAEKEQVAEYMPEEVTSPITVKLGDARISCGVPFGDPLAPLGPPGGGGTGREEGFRKLRHTPPGRAVALALKWLAEHQLPDGGWSFDHTLCAKCRGKCRHAGKLAEARIAATGLALLPFLGAGQTQTEGSYRDTVRRGLYFLVSQMKVSERGGSFYEPGGRMYSHGIASIALCEAYAMTHTKDKHLCIPAQQALNFICYAQDPVGGGWRYEPRQRGDTSVVGWQIMALKSGHLAYLRVPPTVIKMASAYLDGVQDESGARYGYTDPGQGSSATTAIGLLSRMYLGWKKDEPALMRGVQWLSQQGPAKGDMYYNYYATQVMRHFGGEVWKKWDSVMQPYLVDSQAKAGHEAGSWHFKHSHADRGGRLYCTAMAAMTLEVYYRTMPIYGRQSVEEDFPE